MPLKPPPKPRTRAELAEILKRGSLLLKGQVITHESELPDEEDLVGDDPAARAAVAESLREQLAALQSRLDDLEPAHGPQAQAAIKAKGETGPPPAAEAAAQVAAEQSRLEAEKAAKRAAVLKGETAAPPAPPAEPPKS
jgi:hypothetical protein